MGSFCDYLEHEALHHVLGTSYTPPTIYVGLSTTTITDAGGNITEPATGDNYARKAVASWQPAASRTTYNTATITFDTDTTTNWGTITDWFLADSGTRAGGNVLCYGVFAVAKNVVIGNTPSIAAGELDVTINASGSGGGWCTLLCNEMLDHIFGVGSYTPPTIYYGLSTATPLDDGTGAVEPSGSNYSRVTYAGGYTVSGGAGDNTAAITWPVPSGSWGLCTHFVATNHVSTAYGNTVNLFWGDITDQTPTTGDTVDFPIGAMDMTLS